MRVSIYFLLSCLMISSCDSDQPSPKELFHLQSGDILFQDLDCGPYCESIETVTKGVNGAHLSHCGIVWKDGTLGVVVIEAISKGVSVTPLDSFLLRSQDSTGSPKVLVGRMRNWPENELRETVERAQYFVGRPYDEVYNINDSSYYCSELVYYSYLKSGKPVFQLQPMTFKAERDSNFFPVWEEYFNSKDLSVPEGEPGLNPGSISLEKEIEIVHVFGNPQGYKKG